MVYAGIGFAQAPYPGALIGRSARKMGAVRWPQKASSRSRANLKAFRKGVVSYTHLLWITYTIH
jgi:hypothetical protein